MSTEAGASGGKNAEPGAISSQPRNSCLGRERNETPLGSRRIFERWIQVTKFKPSTWVALDDWPLNEAFVAGPIMGSVDSHANLGFVPVLQWTVNASREKGRLTGRFWITGDHGKLRPFVLGGFQDARPLCTVSASFWASAWALGFFAPCFNS